MPRMKLKMWPRKTEPADRDALLELAREILQRVRAEHVERMNAYGPALEEWRETIADRLLAEIPRLDPATADEGIIHLIAPYDFRPPDKPDLWGEERIGAAIEVLEVLPPGDVSIHLREMLSRIGVVYMSYD